jgi:hypothetical protein
MFRVKKMSRYILTLRAKKITSRINVYRVSTLNVEHRQLTLCIQFIDIMPLFRYIKELNYNIKVINSLSSFYYKFFEKITMQFLP